LWGGEDKEIGGDQRQVLEESGKKKKDNYESTNGKAGRRQWLEGKPTGGGKPKRGRMHSTREQSVETMCALAIGQGKRENFRSRSCKRNMNLIE